MKIEITCRKLLPLLLAALMLLSVTACGKRDPGYTINQTNKDTPKSEIVSFYEGNAGTLADIVKKIRAAEVYAQYEYNTYMTDYDKGTVSIRVQQEKRVGLVTMWEACDNKLMNKLADVKFVGRILYDPAIHADVVLLTPRMATEGQPPILAYCASAAGRAALQAGYFHKDSTVTMEKLADGWYCVEVVEN